MEKLLSSLRNVIKELFIVLCITLLLVSFFVPVITSWGGLYYETVDSEIDAIIIKTSMARNEYKSKGEFVWNCEEEEVVYDK